MDVISVAQTGSGKTLAFLVPAFVRIMKERPDHLNPNPTPTPNP